LKIRKKAFIIILAIAIITSFLVYAITSNILAGTIYAAEENHVSEDMERIHMAISNELSRLDSVVGDWASWDDTYQFIQDNNTNYIKTNILPEAFKDLRINLMAFIDLNNSVTFGKIYNLTTGEERPFKFNQISRDYRLNISQKNNQTSGIIETQDGPMLVSCSLILTSNYQGPARGIVLVGRFLDLEEINLLESTTSLPIDVYNLAQNMPANAVKAKDSLNNETKIVISPVNGTYTAGYEDLVDLNSNPVALIRILTIRNELIQLNNSLNYLLMATTVLGVTLVLSSYFLLEKFILSRLMKMSKSVEKTTLDGNSISHIDQTGKDEVSYLAEKINQMIDTINTSQSQLHEYANNLEEKVEEKTSELLETQRKLLQSERLAIIGQMASMVAHDLRSPLTGIKNSAFFLRKRNDLKQDPTVQRTLGLIEESISNANKIVDDLLDYSREVKLEKQTVSLKNLVSDSLSSVRLPENAKLLISVSDTVIVNVDLYKIKRVIVNLINNAIESMSNGGVISIESYINKNDVLLSVTDNGQGISEENQKKLWQPLFTTKSKGIGLGLVICKRFVEAHGGKMDVESVEGKGTKFIIRLSLAQTIE
jgi:signal transduction histidine kinase